MGATAFLGKGLLLNGLLGRSRSYCFVRNIEVG